MATTTVTLSKIEICAVIRFLWLTYYKPIQIHWLVYDVKGEKVISRQAIEEWCVVFRNGLDDDQVKRNCAYPQQRNFTFDKRYDETYPKMQMGSLETPSVLICRPVVFMCLDPLKMNYTTRMKK